MNPFRLLAAALGRTPPTAAPRSRRPARAALTLSALEDRTVPAVGALGLVEGNFLTVVGDDTDNTIVLRQTNGQLTIDGGRFVTSTGPANSISAASVSGFTVIAGAGNDTVQIDSSVTIPGVIEGGDGNDTLAAGSGNTELFGGAGDDKLYGGRGDDRLYGESGNDTLVGGAGRDTAFGGAGADVFSRSTEVTADRMTSDSTVADPARPQLPTTVTPAAAPTLGAFPRADGRDGHARRRRAANPGHRRGGRHQADPRERRLLARRRHGDLHRLGVGRLGERFARPHRRGAGLRRG